MRHLFTLCFLLLLRLTAYSQCCPYMLPVQMLPANPQPGEVIRLVFKVNTPGWGQKVNDEFVRSADTLRYTACYFNGPTAVMQHFSDTVTVGTLPTGSYTIVFVGRMSRDPQQCDETRRNSISTTVQVGTRTLATQPAAPGWALYPVPATGRQLQLQAPARESLQAIKLFDMAGRECYAHPAARLTQPDNQHQLQLPALPAGTYTLRVHSANGAVRNQRVVLQ
ncbi:T9SS type A sorting domain-containing protein [Hymenobacter sp. ASUV-10]|uniref:T9SS type A sorting domain-containing protein n=1 Tax=Hymenobacter aranciens TaxID=3063996 RepID=A0ABT9BDY6_9BACT|nr:T9SS type A sorting domain-containing protein [Hymenobacter sp. ASUV-10]MDO7875247.1 T9SS type A sorting domain-containing protein [Hymenobacter sp. ASUV-10]